MGIISSIFEVMPFGKRKAPGANRALFFPKGQNPFGEGGLSNPLVPGQVGLITRPLERRLIRPLTHLSFARRFDYP
jgi:hypothetical protein